eukprot:10835483-Prorocentrum_lima.AAC.1
MTTPSLTLSSLASPSPAPAGNDPAAVHFRRVPEHFRVQRLLSGRCGRAPLPVDVAAPRRRLEP